MAYGLHIVRSPQITLDEWQSLCANDPSLSQKNEFYSRNPRTGETITIREEHAALWTCPTTQEQYTFNYRRGRISFNHSDAALLKAKGISKSLAARVEGDEGEKY